MRLRFSIAGASRPCRACKRLGLRAAGDRVSGVDIPDALNVVARYPVAALKRATDDLGD